MRHYGGIGLNGWAGYRAVAMALAAVVCLGLAWLSERRADAAPAGDPSGAVSGGAGSLPIYEDRRSSSDVDGGVSDEVLTNETVISMFQMGIPEKLVVMKIEASKCDFDTSPPGLLKLMNSGVPMRVISLIIEEDTHPDKRVKTGQDVTRAVQPPSEGAGDEAEPAYVFERDPSHKPGDLVLVEGGCFDMGDTFGDGGPEEQPVHEVCVDSFRIGRFEVTLGEYRKFMEQSGYKTDAGKDDGCYNHTGQKWVKDAKKNWDRVGYAQTDADPITCVSWYDAQEYINWKSIQDGIMYRFPTEAEWEYVARGGGQFQKYSWGDGPPKGNVSDIAISRKFPGMTIWDGYNDGYVFTAPVGSFEPNAIGVYDMTGNVWEWTVDWFAQDYYAKSPKQDPDGPRDGTQKVLRGGSWFDMPYSQRCSYRTWAPPMLRNFYNGFRLAAPVK